jgi:hypothetical protein
MLNSGSGIIALPCSRRQPAGWFAVQKAEEYE